MQLAAVHSIEMLAQFARAGSSLVRGFSLYRCCSLYGCALPPRDSYTCTPCYARPFTFVA